MIKKYFVSQHNNFKEKKSGENPYYNKSEMSNKKIYI